MGKGLIANLSRKIGQGFTVIGPVLGLLSCVCLMGAELAQLRQFEEARRIFDLRKSLESGGSGEALLYRALVAASIRREMPLPSNNCATSLIRTRTAKWSGKHSRNWHSST